METIIEVATARGMVLDWMVHKATRPDFNVQPWQFCAWGDYRPSVNPLTAHDIIVKYRVSTNAPNDAVDDEFVSQWIGSTSASSEHGLSIACGPTMLIAAMRCVVMARLGEHVPVPETIINHNSNH